MENISTRNLFTSVQMVGAVLLLGLFLITTQIGTSQARSLSTNDALFSDPIMKRNTWWSKKSLDALNTVQHDGIQAETLDSSKCSAALQVYDCYVQKCVQSYVTCAKEAANAELYTACHVLHRLCASSCSTTSFEGSLLL